VGDAQSARRRGTPATVEDRFANIIAYGNPGRRGTDRNRLRGRRSAGDRRRDTRPRTHLLDLARLADGDPRMPPDRAARSTSLDRVFGGGTADQLAARAGSAAI